MTQMNLGNALATLGERESGTVRLKEAIAAWELGLTIGATICPDALVRNVRSRLSRAKRETMRRAAR